MLVDEHELRKIQDPRGGPAKKDEVKYVLPEACRQAVNDLQKDFPGIQIECHLDELDEEFWVTHIKSGQTPVKLSKFVNSFLGEIIKEQKWTGVVIRLTSEERGDLKKEEEGLEEERKGRKKSAGVWVTVEVKVPLSGQDKQFSGISHGNRRLFPGISQAFLDKDGLVIHLESVVALHSGRKFVRSFLLAQAEMFHARKITLSASGFGGRQNGVFAWARYGFVPCNEDWDRMRSAGLKKLGTLDLPEEQRGEMERILLDPSPKAIRRLVYLSWLYREKVKKFLDAILTAHVSWEGELDVWDEVSLSWINAYLNLERAQDEQSKQGEQFKQFESLLPPFSEQQIMPPDSVEKKEEEQEDPVEKTAPPEPLTEEQIQELVRMVRTEEGTLEEVQKDYGEDAYERVRAEVLGK